MNTSQENTFYSLGIAPGILTALDKNNYKVPTPIQSKAIPIGIAGQDIIGIAQTGTGKTMAFGIPMIQRIASMKTRGLIILPTRELAAQVDETLQKFGRALGLKTVILIGGAPMNTQINNIRKNPHIFIGTPGRINDHLQQRTLNLGQIGIVVLDEADRMLDMGFAPQIKKILDNVPHQRQTMLFSATMPDDIVRIATRYMKMPVRVEIARAGTMAEKVEQELYFIKKDAKNRLLQKLLEEYKGTVLVFCRTKFGAKKVKQTLSKTGHNAAEIHSNRSLSQRREALQGFKSGKYRVLVATDIAARGIDVTGIELVINYDLPDNPEDYVHRIGRTGRAGMAGTAISFATLEQKRDVRDIEHLIRTAIPISPVPHLPPELHVSVDRGDRPQTAQEYANNRFRSQEPRERSHSHSQRRDSDDSQGERPQGSRPYSGGFKGGYKHRGFSRGKNNNRSRSGGGSSGRGHRF